MKELRFSVIIALLAIISSAFGCGEKDGGDQGGDVAAGLAHMERGHILLNKNDVDGALNDFVQAAKLLPDSTAPLMAIGDIHEARGEFQEAVEHYRAALALDPTIATAHFKIGYISKHLRGDYATAVVRLTKAVELDSTNATFAFQLADCYHSLERFKESLNYFQRAVELDPDHAYAHYGLGEIYEVHMEWLKDAYSEYEKAVSISPEDPVLRALVGEAYGRQGRYEDALRHLRESLKLAPDSPRAPGIRERIRYIESLRGVTP